MRARRAKRIEKQKIIKVLGDNDDDSVVPVREESASKEKNDSIAKQLSTIFNRHTLTSLKTALSFVNRQILSIKLKLNTHTARHGSLKREKFGDVARTTKGIFAQFGSTSALAGASDGRTTKKATENENELKGE